MSRDKDADKSSAQASEWQNSAWDKESKQIDDYNDALGKLRAQGNPWMDPTYKQNENVLISGAAGSANNAARQQINDASRASGGQNSAAYGATVADLSRQRAQQQTQATAGQNSTDYNNWINYQQWLQNAILAPTGAEGSQFATATGQQTNAQNNIQQANAAGDAIWGNVIGGIAGGVGSVFQGAGKV